MFITRASRHDRDDVMELLDTHGWGDADLSEGVAYIARDGNVVGVVQVVEVAPQTLVVDNVLVREEKRGGGVGDALMRAAMNAKGGTMYLCCHEERIPFYERLGFARVPIEDCPEDVVAFWRKVEDYPTPEGHVHYFMKAR